MEPLDLNKWYDPAKDDFYFTVGEPKVHTLGWYHFIHFTWWTGMQKKDGKPAFFWAFHLFWKIRFYICNAKIDGTRCFMYWLGELGGDPVQCGNDSYKVYVANASQPTKWSKWGLPRKEHWAFRIKNTEPDHLRWNNQGGV